MRKKLAVVLVTVVAVAAACAGASAAPIKFARYPHVAAGRLAFSYHNDIWVANEDGSNPVRLTAHVARDTFPRFSPDGKWIAFTSNRMGNDDVFVIPVTGGEPRQITHNTSNDTALYWTPDGKRIIISTSLGPRAFGSPLYTVPAEGGVAEPLQMDTGTAGMIKQDGSMVAFNRLGRTYWRKGYRGNAADDIWVQDLKTLKITRLTDTDPKNFRNFRQDGYPMWGADGMIYFSSERDGYFNIWKVAPTGGQPVQVTSHREDGVQFPSISPDGKTITYENDFDLWTLDVPNGKPRRVVVDMAFDPKQNLVSVLRSQNRADGFDPSPDGSYVAIDFHGEIFIVPTDPEVGEKRQVTSSGWRDRRAKYSPDGRYIVYTSDESREEEVWLYDTTTGARRKLSTHQSFKEMGDWSPDSKRFAYTAANRLFIVDVTAATPPLELAYNQAGGFQVTGFSPDGKWLVYTRRDDDMNAEVYLFDIAAKQERNATQSPFSETNGTITPDGKKLVFISDRDAGVNHLFVVPLEKLTEDPDDPLVKERLKKAKPEKKDEAAAPTTRIDVDGIDRRAVQVTRGTNPSSNYFLSADGKLIYFISSDERGRGLFSVTIDGKDRKRVTDGTFQGLVPTADRKKVFYTQDNELYQMEMSGQYRKTRVPFTVNVTVDQRAEWLQIFDECWRVMKYRFYDEKMHGTDWAAAKARYEPLLKYVGENEDVYDLANEMIGELNASHTGVSGPRSNQMPPVYASRYLGFEVQPEGGAYRIDHIYRDGPADKEWLNLKVGDYVLAIDGHALKAGDDYWKVLNQSLNDYVTVRVAASAAANDMTAREVRIRPVTSLADIKYEEWVKKNREFVDKESNNQIAYVHIRSMNQPSLERFQNEINQFWNKKGIIVDIRYNGGGNIDQQLLDILERRPYEYWNSRWGSRTWGRRPRQAIAGPKVMLINWRSASDSEVTPLGFRDLKLGTIVGTATNASVIATGSYALINGGSIRTPGSLVVSYDPTKPNNYGINLENYGVEPDIWVENTPEDELKGFDRQLKAAVDEALKQLKSGKWQYTPPTEQD
ncbi:MAG: DPP IV N-terminal domain-containing protein [Vicinamibacterales bacterium]